MTLAPRIAAGAAACSAVLLALAGCASAPPAKPEVAVAERAQARYDALIAKNYKAAYEFLSPAYRARFNFENHLRARPIITTYTAAKVLSVECESDAACKTQIEVTSKGLRVPAGRGMPNWPITSVETEQWVRVDGQWWRYISQ